jgi:hypothetical protein
VVLGTNFIGELMKRPEIAELLQVSKADYPQLEMEVDDVKAEQLGVNVETFCKQCKRICSGFTSIRF